MGSELTYSNTGRNFIVWGDLSIMGIYRLARGWSFGHDYLDRSEPLTVTGIIETDEVGRSPYGELLDFLEHTLGYQRDSTLFPFCYDWRLAVEKTSGQLVQKIKDVRAKTNEEVLLISHSLGCIVTRYALNSRDNQGNLHIHHREVAALIEMAPPIAGASVAFGATQYPESLLLGDTRVKWLSRSLPFIWNRIVKGMKKSVNSFESLFQLFPPDTDLILRDETGNLYSALRWPGWGSASQAVQDNVGDAGNFHTNGGIIAAPHPQNVQEVYILYYEDHANAPNTDYLYEFRSAPPFTVDRKARQSVPGDKRVATASCDYNCNEQGVDCRPIQPTAQRFNIDPHYWLPAMDETKDWLRVNIPNL